MNFRAASQVILGVLAAFFLQRLSSLMASFVVLSATGQVPLHWKSLFHEHLSPTLPAIIFDLSTTALLVIVILGLVLFLLCNAGLMVWTRRKDPVFMRGVQIGFVFALLPLFTLGQIFLVQVGLHRLSSEISRRDAAGEEVSRQAEAGDCDSLDPAEQPGCFSRLAAARKDPEICTRIGSGGGMDQFQRDFCLSDVALAAPNPDFCHRIQRASLAATCVRKTLKSLNGQNGEHPAGLSHGEICDRFQPKSGIEENDQAACYREVAVYERNPAICERIQSPTLRAECAGVVAARTSGRGDSQPAISGASAPSVVSGGQGSSESFSAAPLPQGIPFSSAYFTLSLVVPSGFEVRDQQNSIRIAKAPFTDRDIGDDNAFFGLTRYSQYNTQETENARYRKLLKNLKESTIVIDGSTFPTLSGEDWGRFAGSSAGKVFVVFFPKSWLEIIERPANADQSFDPLTLGRELLATMRFSK
ncbi:MAG: hypothetical protein PHZ00_07740 [Candidatus Peribacteraceae bacterium]|nr:hypothetical protein [Candidatus Peribacteraceae bacterium]